MADSWSELDEEEWGIWAGLHRLLLRLAGQMPDDWVTHTRGMLGGGDLAYLPDTISGSVVQLGVSLTPAELEFLPRVLPAFGQGDEPPVGLDQVRVAAETPATGHQFSPAPPAVLASAGARIPASLDLTGGASDALWDLPPELAELEDLADDLTDTVDSGVVVEVSGEPGVIGMWRTWRSGPDGSRRIFLVEVEPRVPAWQVAYDIQRELVRDGEEHPQVEVYWSGDELTPYHRAARSGAALLWARQPGRVRVARVPEVLAPDHPRVTDPREGDRLLAALRGGAVVPAGHRTDGHWVWPEAVADHLAEHGLAPDPELAEHLLASPPPSTVDGVGLFRAENALRAASR